MPGMGRDSKVVQAVAARSANQVGRSAEGVGAVVAREAGAVRVSGMGKSVERGLLGDVAGLFKSG